MTRPDRERIYKAIIGERNQAYYLSYFERADARGYPPVSWHWPVLFFGVLWFVYRRMYRWAIGSFILPQLAAFVAAGIDQFIPGSGRPLLLVTLIGFYAVWLPLVANGLYYKQAQRLISTAAVLHEGNEQRQFELISGRGGVHAQLPLFLIVAITVMSLLLGMLSGTQA